MRSYPTDNAYNPTRRHFLHVMTVVASAAAAPALSTASQAQTVGSGFGAGGRGHHDGHHGGHHHGGHHHGGGRGPSCFLTGTNILSSHGSKRVEELSIGDLVITAEGQAKPIKWIGRQIFRRRTSSGWPERVLPIRVARSALADNVPHADLYLSPVHALFIDGVLIPVMHLVNGTSITPAMREGMADIEYFHIELETHEVIFADGAPAETLLCLVDDREAFTNFIEYERLYGREPRPEMTPYAPVLDYPGGRAGLPAHLMALLRLGVSHVIDVRDPIQVAYDRVAARATDLVLSA